MYYIGLEKQINFKLKFIGLEKQKFQRKIANIFYP